LDSATVHEEFRAGHETALVGGEEQDRVGDVVRRADAAERDPRHQELLDLLGLGAADRFVQPGVSIVPGLTALTRMPRPFSSVAQVRAKDRSAALVAE
jgi:hypothetical protein